ncbi:hypothetical protein ACQJBY_042793 [Aegilops geniculata]
MTGKNRLPRALKKPENRLPHLQNHHCRFISTSDKPETSLFQAYSRQMRAMAEELSAKRHRGETSNKSSNLDDVHVPGEKREYTKTLTGIELHGKETLEIVCTSEPGKADEMMSRLRMKGGGLYPSFIGVDVEYTSKDEPPQMAAVLQLCVEELCLVYHIASATKW